MADGADKGILIRSKNRVLKALKIQHPQEISNSSTPGILQDHLGNYGPDELSNMPGFNRKTLEKSKLSPEDLFGNLLKTAGSTQSITDKLDNIKSAGYEIPMATIILVSSIISPNDMQTDLVSVGNTDTTTDASTLMEICDLVDDHFNNKLHFGEMLTRYVQLALIDKGAHGVMVLPQAALRSMNAVTTAWDTESGSMENFNDVLIDCDNSGDWKTAEYLKDAQLAIESLIPGIEGLSDKDRSTLVKGFSATPMQIIKDNGDAFFITRDLKEVGRGAGSSRGQMSKLLKVAERSILPANLLQGNDSEGKPINPVFSMTDIYEQYIKDGDMPSVVEFPTTAIVPVCVPGSPHERIGVFLLFGADGHPLQVDANMLNMSASASPERLAFNAMKATYGSQTTQVINTMKATDDVQYETGASVFTVAVQHILAAKLEKMGLHGLEVSLHGAIGKSLFFNMLRKNKIKMVFVPEPLFMYYAFDYRKDGTGKSILEDLEYILSLRSAMIAANTMAAMENSTRHFNVEVSIDEQNQNVLQTMEMVRRNIITKYSPRFTTNLQQAAESILNSHIHIKGSDMAGTNNNLNVNSEVGTRGGVTPDTSFLDTLNNWTGLLLYVTPSMLNQLSESEYSRSVATVNICFANRIRMWQNKLYPENRKFIQNYVCNHAGLLKQIRDILTGKAEDASDANVKAMAGDIDDTRDSVDDQMKRIIAGFEINLPKPNVSTGKAHYEEIRAFLDTVETMVTKRYDDALAQTDDQRKQLAVLRSTLMSQMIQKYMQELGYHELVDLPDIDTVTMDSTVKLSRFLNNFNRKMAIDEKIMNKQPPEPQY